MLFRARRFSVCVLLCTILCAGLLPVAVHAAGPVASQAAIGLSFDEASGGAGAAVAGTAEKYQGQLINGAARVPSPFWNQSGKQALLLDAAANQFVQLNNVPYLDRPDAVSLSFFFLSLHDLNDAAARGIVAKRSGNKQGTNYGINYVAKSDIFQLYVNDGSGFRVATYSVKDVIGYRRLVHLTSTFQIADAPAPDADSDQDDVLVRLFVNGQQVKPVKVSQGNVIDNDAWLTDVNSATLLNDVPLTLGCSFPEAESISGLIDEFLLFSRALSPKEAADLFLEMSGPNGAELARRELLPRLQPLPPRIAALSLQGLQVGATTRISINGRNLGRQPRIELPGVAIRQTAVEGSTVNRFIVDLSIPAGTKSGYYPLRVHTQNGISNAVPVAIDDLPQFSSADASTQEPARLPAAFSGALSGSQRDRVYFQGKAGQRVVAEVEARRLGARMEPVIEIKTEQGTPLLIEWGHVHLKGDARCEITLPSDGLYYVELHDLAFKAPGRNPYRLKIGDLKLVDAWFPPVAVPGSAVAVEPVGTGVRPGTKIGVDLFDVSTALATRIPLPSELGLSGPAPVIGLSDGVEIVETQPAGKQLQEVDATFAGGRVEPVFINGRIAEKEERDRYVLNVTAGQKLNLSIEGRSINSPIDAELSVLSHPQGATLAVREDRPGSRDPSMDYTVPADVRQIQVAVRDLHGRGGSHFLYRLEIAPAGRPDFQFTVMTPQVSIPQNGRALLRAQVNRNGYNGPIKLSLLGDPSLTFSPTEIPAGGGNRKLLVTLTRRDAGAMGDLKNLKIVVESVGVTPAVRHVASVFPGLGRVSVDGFRDLLPMAVIEPAGLSLNLGQLPPALFKGAVADAALTVTRSDPQSQQAVRLSLVSTENPRPANPQNPRAGNKPLIRAVPNQVLPPGTKDARMKLEVPLDVAEAAIDFVVRADVIPHPYSNQVIATAWSEPFRLPVRTAASVVLDAKTFDLVAGQTGKVRGTLKRTAGFTGVVNLALTGLPDGYSAPAVSVPADQEEQFELSVTVPANAKPQALQKIALTTTTPGGGSILPNQPVALKVVAGK